MDGEHIILDVSRQGIVSRYEAFGEGNRGIMMRGEGWQIRLKLLAGGIDAVKVALVANVDVERNHLDALSVRWFRQASHRCSL